MESFSLELGLIGTGLRLDALLLRRLLGDRRHGAGAQGCASQTWKHHVQAVGGVVQVELRRGLTPGEVAHECETGVLGSPKTAIGGVRGLQDPGRKTRLQRGEIGPIKCLDSLTWRAAPSGRARARQDPMIWISPCLKRCQIKMQERQKPQRRKGGQGLEYLNSKAPRASRPPRISAIQQFGPCSPNTTFTSSK